MTKIALTASTIRDLPYPETGQTLHFDAKLSGFAVRVTPNRKTYIVQARVEGRTRRVTVAPTDVLSVDEARKAGRVALGKMAGGVDPNAAKAEAKVKGINLTEASDSFFKARLLKATTEATYRQLLKVYLSQWAKTPLKDISPQAVVKRFNAISEGAGPATANAAMRTFRSIWNYTRADTANADGTYVLPECPVRRLSDTRVWHKLKPRSGHVPGHAFGAWFSSLDKLESHNPSHARDFRDFLTILMRTGLRRSELAGLPWSEVDLKDRTLTIVDPKNGRDFTLPMARQVEAIFRHRWDNRPEGAAFVFPSNSVTGHVGNPKRLLDPVRKACGVHFTFHDCRRSYATLAEGIGIPYLALKRLMNHAEGGDITALHYIVRDTEKLRPHAQTINDAIDQLAGLVPQIIAQEEAA
jgi:integrase